MVLRTSFMRTKQFICLAARQSFRNLIEQYMELKEKEKSANNQNVSVGKNQIVPGYMDINPRELALQMHMSPLVNYNPQMFYVVKKMTYDVSMILNLVLWFTYTKYLVKWFTECMSGIFGYFLNK